MLEVGTKICDRYVGGELAGEQIAAHADHEEKQNDRNDADEDVGDDESMTKAPEDVVAGPAEAEAGGADCEDEGGKDRPAMQLRSGSGTGCPGEGDEEGAQCAGRKGGAAPQGAGVESPRCERPD